MTIPVLILWLFAWQEGPADFVLVTSQETPIEFLSSYQLKQIYLGKLDRLVGTRLQPLHLKKDHPLRQLFENLVLGNRADLEDYWLQQSLKGGPRPPLEVGDWALMLAYIKRNPGFLGYIPAEHLEEALNRGLRQIKIR